MESSVYYLGPLTAVKEWLKYNVFYSHEFEYALCGGQLDIMIYLYESKKYIPGKVNYTTLLDRAIICGHLEIVKWLGSSKNPNLSASKRGIELAVSKGRLDIVEWLFYNCKFTDFDLAMKFALDSDNLEIVKWLHKNVKYDAQELFHHALRKDIIIWFYNNHDVTCTDRHVEYAARNGRLKEVKWLHSHCPKFKRSYWFKEDVKDKQVLDWFKRARIKPYKSEYTYTYN